MSQPRRVLMTTDAVGGVWTYALDLSEGLAFAGVQVTLCVLGPRPTAQQSRQALSIPGLRLVETDLPLDWTANGPQEIEAASDALAELCAQGGFDLLHLNSPALAASGRVGVPVLGFCHSCTRTWWEAVRADPLAQDFLWRAELVRRGMSACDLLAAPTAAFAAATALAYDLPLPRVVRNGRASPLVQAGGPRSGVFASGRLWDEGKNFGLLDEAAGLCATPITAAGPLQSPDGSGAFSARRLRLPGPLDQVSLRDRLSKALIYASPALYEPFGLGVLEAAQAGCALVLSDIPSFRELWDGAAVFAPARDPAAFAAAFDRLGGDPALAERLGKAAARRAGAYSAKAMVQATFEAYGTLMTRKFPGPFREAAA